MKIAITLNHPGVFTIACLLAFALRPTRAAESKPSFAEVAERVLKEGKPASMNAFFADQLGISKGKTPIRLKRLSLTSKGATNVFNVSLEDKRTVVLSHRENNLGTFYLTDLTGKLKKAIVNDSNIKDGGLTNLPLIVAAPKFEAEKRIWLTQDLTKAH